MEVWMSRILAALFVVLTTSGLSAQRPRLSPHETHEFTLDGTRITIEYGRPSKRGREIWGALVPFGRWWMPGADEATTITTSRALLVGSLAMPAGAHTLYMLVDEKAPKLIVSKETGQFHTQYHPNLDLGRVDLALTTLADPVEQLTIEVEPRAGGGAVLKLAWDTREYSVPIAVRP
jgi:hypothetical protein